MTTTAPTLIDLFYQGKYAEVVDRALLAQGAHFEPAETPAVVAAMAAVGQLDDAELLLTHQRDLLDTGAQAFALYHLATAAVACGRYGLARQHLGRLFALRNQAASPEALFFVYQGIAWYRYATGRLGSALLCAHRATGFARRAGGLYGRLLQSELLGHLQTLTGSLESGLSLLATAASTAERLGRAGSARSLRLASRLCVARYGEAPKEAVADLLSELAATPANDAFARASLLLELTRQHTLSRQERAAKEALTQATRLILGLGSRRYEAALNLRLVDLLALEGAHDQALIVSQSALRLLQPEADALLELEITARRVTLLDHLKMPEARAAAARRLADLERRSGFVAPPEPPMGKEQAVAAALNHRQLAFLSELRGGELTDVHAYRQRFKISEITACRDLAGLARGRYLRRLGKARATRYVLRNPL